MKPAGCCKAMAFSITGILSFTTILAAILVFSGAVGFGTFIATWIVSCTVSVLSMEAIEPAAISRDGETFDGARGVVLDSEDFEYSLYGDVEER